MNKRRVLKLQAEMSKVNVPGACRCCPIALYRELFSMKLKGMGCSEKYISLCKELDIKCDYELSCITIYKAFMDIKVNRFCRV